MTNRVNEYLRTCDMRKARRDLVAANLGMSGNTMGRFLRAEGVGYRTLLFAEQRRRLSDLLAINPHMDCGLAAKKLGYSQPNSAGRTFNRLFGVTLRDSKRATA